MKKKNKEEIRSKSAVELEGEIKKRQEELMKLRLDVLSAKIKNTSSLKRKSDELAVLKTIKREKELLKA